MLTTRTRSERASKSNTPRPSWPTSHQPILSILKTADLQQELPEFNVVNVEIWSLDGSQMMNIMDSNLRGVFKIFGSLKLSKEQAKYYCKGARNGPQEFEAEITSYAIDAAPEAEIWIGTVCGWLHIRPSEQYAAIFADIASSVSLLYQCIDLEDDVKAEKRPLKVENFLFEYAIADGRGLMENQLKAIFQHNAVSILSHMHPLPDMKNKKLYLWMKDAFPDIYKYVADESKALLARQEAIAKGVQQSIPLRQQSPVRRPPPALQTVQPHVAAKPPSALISVSSSSSNSPDPTRQPPAPVPIDRPILPPQPSGSSVYHSIPDDEATTLSPVQVIQSMISSQDPKTSNMTIATLQNRIYQEWSVWWPRLAGGMIRLHSSTILQQLPSAWKHTRLYDTLKETSRDFCSASRRDKELAAARKRTPRPPRSRATLSLPQIHAISDDEWISEAADYQFIVRRKSKPRPSAKRESNGSHFRSTADAPLPPDYPTISTNEPTKEFVTRANQRANHEAWKESIASRSRSPSPDPTTYEYKKLQAQRKLPPSQQATPRPTVGKLEMKTPHSQKGLPHTLQAHPSGKMTRLKPKASKRPADTDPDSRVPKRSRMSNSPSENDASSPTPANRETSPSSSSSTSDPELDPEQEKIKPSSLNMTRGPNGSMRCLGPQCHFVEHLPDSKEGRDRMISHFGAHEREDPVLVLAKREATLNGRTVNHLMEKLLEKERMEEDAKKMRGGVGKLVIGVEIDSFGAVPARPLIKRKF